MEEEYSAFRFFVDDDSAFLPEEDGHELLEFNLINGVYLLLFPAELSRQREYFFNNEFFLEPLDCFVWMRDCFFGS